MKWDAKANDRLLTVDSGAAAHHVASRHYHRAAVEEFTRLRRVSCESGAVLGEVINKSARLNDAGYVARVFAALDDQDLEGRFGGD